MGRDGWAWARRCLFDSEKENCTQILHKSQQIMLVDENYTNALCCELWAFMSIFIRNTSTSKTRLKIGSHQRTTG